MTLKATGYFDHTEQLTFAAGVPSELKGIRLRKTTATLRVEMVEPAVATVFIGGRERGTTANPLAGLAPEAALHLVGALPEDGARDKSRRLLAALNEGLLARLRYAVQTSTYEDLDDVVERAYDAELSGLAWARDLVHGDSALSSLDDAAPSLSDLEAVARRM